MARAPALQMGLPWQMILRSRPRPFVRPSVRRNMKHFVALMELSLQSSIGGEERRGRAEGGKWIVA